MICCSYLKAMLIFGKFYINRVATMSLVKILFVVCMTLHFWVTYLWAKVVSLLNSYVKILITNVIWDVTRSQSGAFMNGINTFTKETPEKYLVFFNMWGYKKLEIWNLQESAHQNQTTLAPWCRTCSFQNCEKLFFAYKWLRLRYFFFLYIAGQIKTYYSQISS